MCVNFPDCVLRDGFRQVTPRKGEPLGHCCHSPDENWGSPFLLMSFYRHFSLLSHFFSTSSLMLLEIIFQRNCLNPSPVSGSASGRIRSKQWIKCPVESNAAQRDQENKNRTFFVASSIGMSLVTSVRAFPGSCGSSIQIAESQGVVLRWGRRKMNTDEASKRCGKG